MKKINSLQLQSLSIFIATSLILFFRLTAGRDALFRESLWAEDGLFALCNIIAPPSTCFFNSFSGYWSALPRLNAYFVSRFPLSDWAFVNNILTLLFLAMIATFTYLAIYRRSGNKLVVLSLVLAPSVIGVLSHEVLMVSNSIFLILGYYILLIYLYSDVTEFRFGVKFWIFLIFTIFYTISNPLAFLFLLVIISDQLFFKNRSFNKLVFTILIFIANLIQGFFVLVNYSDRNQAMLSLSLLRTFVFEFIKSFSLLLYSPKDINYFSERNFQSIFFGALIFGSLILILIFFIKNIHSALKALFTDRLLLFPFFVLCFSLIISVVTGGAPFRYQVMSTLYALLFLVGFFQTQRTTIIKFGYTILFSCVLVNGILNFQASGLRSTGPLWSQQIEMVRNYCLDNPNEFVRIIFSPNWTASSQHPYVIQEPTTEKIECSVLNFQD